MLTLSALKKGDSRILVVDDNEVALQAMADLLKREGFPVLTARSGMDALHQAKVNDDRVSLILLDLWMPIVDGWEVLRRKKQDSRIADIPVIVLSAVPPVSLDGARAVLKKPVDPEPLMNAIKQFCDSAQQ